MLTTPASAHGRNHKLRHDRAGPLKQHHVILARTVTMMDEVALARLEAAGSNIVVGYAELTTLLTAGRAAASCK